jgi:hypothetical protein
MLGKRSVFQRDIAQSASDHYRLCNFSKNYLPKTSSSLYLLHLLPRTSGAEQKKAAANVTAPDQPT